MSGIIDSRELIERAQEIAAEIEQDNEERHLPAGDREEIEAELAAIETLADSGITDWEHGATLIPDDDSWVDYCRELAEDLGMVQEGAGWPNNRIDWDAAADDLRVDYTSVTFMGTDYLVRA